MKWLIRRTNEEYVSYLSKALNVSKPFAQVLLNRGIRTPEEAAGFINPSTERLSDPFLMGGMAAAVDAIGAARKAGTRVLVHGDYDADGITATAILVGALRGLGLDVQYHIPNRFTEGYGFNPPGVIKAKELGAGLIITVDCGISAFEAVSLAKKSGIGVVVTDHHEPALDPVTRRPLLPDALSIVNPKVSNPELSGLSGAGVALKLIQALSGELFETFFDLASIGTLADSMPLTGENRIIVKKGLGAIREGIRPGIRALKAAAGLQKEPRAWTLSFTIVPRMNAAGRLSDASGVVELLLSESEEKAMEFALSLEKKNQERQKIEEGLLKEALALLSDKGYGPAIVLWGEHWHEGVIGIVASRIAERFGKPAFVFSVKDGIAKGSARSIPGLDVHAALTEAKDLLLGFGGHTSAAGMRLKAEDLGAFEKRMDEIVGKNASDFTPSLNIDADIALGEINFNLIKEIEMLEPFGAGNPEPLFGSRGLKVLNPRVVGNNHLKMKLKSRSRTVDAIWFAGGEFFQTLEDLSAVDAAYNATVNDWEGGRTLQLNLRALRKNES